MTPEAIGTRTPTKAEIEAAEAFRAANTETTNFPVGGDRGAYCEVHGLPADQLHLFAIHTVNGISGLIRFRAALAISAAA